MSFQGSSLIGIAEQITEARVSAYPKVVSLADFFAADLPRPPQLVEGLIHQGTMTMVAAPPKSRKSWLLFQLALCVASGAPFLGRATTKAKVLIVNPEIRQEFMQNRMSSMVSASGGVGIPVDIANVSILNLRGESFDVDGLCETIKANSQDVGLICLDSLYQLLGDRDENSAGEIGDLLRRIDQVATNTGAAIVFTHHFAKGNAAVKDVLDRSSGSGVLGRYPDGIITMTRHKDEGVYSVECVLRNFAPVDKFAVRFEHPLVVTADDVDPDQLKGKGGSPRKYDIIDTENALLDGMTRTEWQAKVIRKTSMSEGTFRTHLNQLLSQGLVEKHGKNQFRHRKQP